MSNILRGFFVKYDYIMNAQNIGMRINEIRTENHLTQAQFGAKLSVSQDTVSLWEKGKSVPTTEFIILIARTFRVSTDYLLGLTEY